jgi:hypothetical protein
MRSRLAPACILCLLIAAVAAPAFAIDAFDFTSPRQKSMGGRHVAMADDYSVLFTNPAGLADLPTTYAVADLGIQAIGPVFDIANLLVSGTPSTTSILKFLSDNGYKIYAGVDTSGPIALGFTGDGLGFGLFNRTRAILNMSSVNSIRITAAEDLLLSGGYAHSFDLGSGHQLSAGIGAKGFVRGEMSPSLGILEVLGLISNSNSNPSSLLEKSALTITTGVGCDLGIRWDWQERVAAGLVYRDAYSPAIASSYSDITAFVTGSASSEPAASVYQTLPSSLDFGFMWSPDLGRLGQVIDSLTLALDYKDILDLLKPIPRNPILNASVGLEARVLDIVSLRAGIADALLSAGMGLNLTVCTVNLAVFGTELGIDPGRRTCYNLLVDFDFKY